MKTIESVRIYVWILLLTATACGYDRDVVPQTITVSFDDSKKYDADGTTKVPITVRIPDKAAPSFRSVRLHTRAGRFDTGDTAIVLDLRLKPDTTLNLSLGTKPATYLITAETGDAAVYKVTKAIELKPLKQAAVFKTLTSSGTTNMVADGKSEATFTLLLGVNTKINFSVEKGTIRQFGGTPQQQVTVDGGDRKQATIIFTVGRSVGNYQFRFNTPDNAYDSTVTFAVGRAYADQIVIDLPKTTVAAAGDQMGVKATLLRSFGQPSIPATVTFSAVLQGTSTAVGNFIPASASASEEGVAEVQFAYDNSVGVAGQMITLTAAVDGPSGKLSAIRTITIK